MPSSPQWTLAQVHDLLDSREKDNLQKLELENVVLGCGDGAVPSSPVAGRSLARLPDLPALNTLQVSNCTFPHEMDMKWLIPVASCLRHLSVVGCGLKEVPPIAPAAAANLLTLDLSDNHISWVTLPPLPQLQLLDISGNEIARLAGLRGASLAPHLRTVRLRGCPVELRMPKSQLRVQLSSMLPHLEQIDDEVVHAGPRSRRQRTVSAVAALLASARSSLPLDATAASTAEPSRPPQGQPPQTPGARDAPGAPPDTARSGIRLFRVAALASERARAEKEERERKVRPAPVVDPVSARKQQQAMERLATAKKPNPNVPTPVNQQLPLASAGVAFGKSLRTQQRGSITDRTVASKSAGGPLVMHVRSPSKDNLEHDHEATGAANPASGHSTTRPGLQTPRGTRSPVRPRGIPSTWDRLSRASIRNLRYPDEASSPAAAAAASSGAEARPWSSGLRDTDKQVPGTSRYLFAADGAAGAASAAKGVPQQQAARLHATGVRPRRPRGGAGAPFASVPTPASAAAASGARTHTRQRAAADAVGPSVARLEAAVTQWRHTLGVVAASARVLDDDPNKCARLRASVEAAGLLNPPGVLRQVLLSTADETPGRRGLSGAPVSVEHLAELRTPALVAEVAACEQLRAELRRLLRPSTTPLAAEASPRQLDFDMPAQAAAVGEDVPLASGLQPPARRPPQPATDHFSVDNSADEAEVEAGAEAAEEEVEEAGSSGAVAGEKEEQDGEGVTTGLVIGDRYEVCQTDEGREYYFDIQDQCAVWDLPTEALKEQRLLLQLGHANKS